MESKQDDLYCFTNTKTIQWQVAKSTTQLWHHHLGHLSNKVLSFLSNEVSEICSTS